MDSNVPSDKDILNILDGFIDLRGKSNDTNNNTNGYNHEIIGLMSTKNHPLSQENMSLSPETVKVLSSVNSANLQKLPFK
jgi:hypothetical protein